MRPELPQVGQLASLLALTEPSLNLVVDAAKLRVQGADLLLEDPVVLDQAPEEQARRAMEKRGVDVDGGRHEEAGRGRRVAVEEVQGLERVVQAMGGADGMVE